MEKEQEIIEFFNKCKENKQKLLNQKNSIINKLLRLLKATFIPQDQFLQKKEEWNTKREETPDEKNRRECEEMLEEIREKKNLLQQMRFNVASDKLQLQREKDEFVAFMNEMKKERNTFSMKKEFDKLASTCVKTNDFKSEKDVIKNQLQSVHSNMKQVASVIDLIQNNYTQLSDQINLMLRYEYTQRSLHFNLTPEERYQLEEWTGLRCSQIVFDSYNNPWNRTYCSLNDCIIGRSQLLFLIEEDDGEKFGYYFNTEVYRRFKQWIRTDRYTFQFNLNAKGNMHHPMKYEIYNLETGGISLFRDSESDLIWLGNITLFKHEFYDNSYCIQNDKFNYHGINDALRGISGRDNTFHIKRLLVIQME